MAAIGSVLSSPEDALARAWMAFDAAHDLVEKALERELARRHGAGLSAYRLLRRLAESHGDDVRLATLAADVLLSPSRVSRITGELERRGYLERGICAGDGRGVTAALTPMGRRAFAELHRTYLETLGRELSERLEPCDVDALLRVCSNLG